MSNRAESQQAIRAAARFENAAGDLNTRAYNTLRDLIISGRLAPGTRIIEAEIADRLGISRTPVWSALQRLQQEGYIVTSGSGRRSRFSVAPMTEEDARELFSIVAELEGLAARRGAWLEPKQRAALVSELNRRNAALEHAAAADRPDHNRIFNLDQAFHRCYVEFAAGPRLVGLHHAVKPQSERYIRLYISALVDEIGTSVREHADTVRSIERADADAAHGAVRTNWTNAAARLARVIRTLGERGAW